MGHVEVAERIGLPLQPPDKSVEQKELFKKYLDEQWGQEAAAATVFRNWAFLPIPLPNRWDIPASIDVQRLTWEQVHTENFIDEVWPSIEMLLGDDVLNREWAARVATVLSLFNIIRVIPVVMESLKDAKENQ